VGVVKGGFSRWDDGFLGLGWGGDNVGAGAAEGDGVGAVDCVLACAGVLGRRGC